jgi:tetratricopeptide (TPR) repeat protein
MKTTRFDKASRRHTYIATLGIIVLTFLVLISIAGATQNSGTWINKGVNLVKLGNSDEAIKACDKAIKINSHNSYVWYNKGLEQE